MLSQRNRAFLCIRRINIEKANPFEHKPALKMYSSHVELCFRRRWRRANTKRDEYLQRRSFRNSRIYEVVRIRKHWGLGGCINVKVHFKWSKTTKGKHNSNTSVYYRGIILVLKFRMVWFFKGLCFKQRGQCKMRDSAIIKRFGLMQWSLWNYRTRNTVNRLSSKSLHDVTFGCFSFGDICMQFHRVIWSYRNR